MRNRAWRDLGVASAIGLAVAPIGARAGEAVTFAIPSGPFKAAATAFALQARVSIDLSAAQGCGPSSGFRGRADLDTALKALLRGAGCEARLISPRVYKIVPKALAAVATPPAPTLREEGESPARLSELVIVATRRLALADRLAYSVSALDQRAAAARGVRDAADLALAVPSMTMTNLGPGRDKVILRGLSDGPLTGQTQSMVGIYLDDVRLTYNAPDPDLLMVDIGQVEVLRGPQGALYGAGSLGGVLQLRTHRPDLDAFDAGASLSASTTRGGEAGGLASAMINVPMLNGRAGVRLVGYAERQGGYIDDLGRGRPDINDTRRNGVRVSARVKLADDWTAETGVTSQWINSKDTQYADRGVGTYARRNRIAEPHDNDFLEVHVGAQGGFLGQDAKLTLAAVRHDLSSRYDASAAPPVSVPLGAAVAFDDDNHVGAVVAEASLASRPAGRIQWQVGAFLARTRQGRDGQVILVDATAAPPLAAETRRDVLGEAALFGEAIGDVGHGWSVTLGGRLFATRSEASSLAASAGASALFRDAQSYVGFAPKIVVSFAPNPSTLVYVQAAEGYRSGGFNTAVIPTQVFDTVGGEPQRRYDGDELWSYEAGTKRSWLEGRLRLRAAVFLASWKDIQSDQLLPSGLPYTANLGDGRNIGLEFEGSYARDGLRLDANFLLNHPELESVNAAFPGRKDLGLAGAPKGSASLAASYERTVGRGWRMGLDLRGAYVGRSRLSFDGVTAPSMGGYATTRVAGRLWSDRLSLDLALDNLFDSAGDTFAYGNPFTLRLSRQATPQRPRTISLEVRARY
ncbi:TonB-dependent receptor domain-containing protein [Caulobacter segnis]|uniref:TonB-dependent receptor domain-containing protein n=1 Tax=Caulobacter segnis TaxID=88688 RepID=UPI001CBC13CD|nr:TonB-dependent receptor [Caulobacter segnis]UAL09933.1 TonB-dependent receptor [Caulobacter segnis]